MFRLYKRGKVWWAAFDGGDRLSTKKTDKEAADLWCRAEDRRRADPAYAAAQAATLEVAIRAFLAWKREEKKADATVGFYKEKLGTFVELWGLDCRLAAIDATKVDGFITERREPSEPDVRPVSDHSISKELGALRGLLRLMRRRGLYHADPAMVLPVGFSSGYAPRETWLTPEQADALVDELETGETPRHAGPVAFALATGARLSEVYRAERADVDEATGLVLLRGSKTKKAWRTVPVLPGPWRDFLTVALRHGAESGRLFPDWTNAQSGNERRDIARACAAADVPVVTWNDLRRSHAKWLRAAGVEPHLIGEVLGHETSTMAERVYGRPSPEQLAKLLAERVKPR